jgi:hypothetical protein
MGTHPGAGSTTCNRERDSFTLSSADSIAATPGSTVTAYLPVPRSVATGMLMFLPVLDMLLLKRPPSICCRKTVTGDPLGLVTMSEARTLTFCPEVPSNV